MGASPIVANYSIICNFGISVSWFEECLLYEEDVKLMVAKEGRNLISLTGNATGIEETYFE